LLDVAAGAVLFLGVFVLFCLQQRFTAQLRMRGFRGFQPFNLTRRPCNICRLTACVAQRLRNLQPLLLFLFIKYRIKDPGDLAGICSLADIKSIH